MSVTTFLSFYALVSAALLILAAVQGISAVGVAGLAAMLITGGAVLVRTGLFAALQRTHALIRAVASSDKPWDVHRGVLTHEEAEIAAALGTTTGIWHEQLRLAADWTWQQDESLRFTQIAAQSELAQSCTGVLQVGKTVQELACSTAPACPDAQAFAAADATQRARLPLKGFIYPVKVHDGTLRYISLSSSPAVNCEGEMPGHYGIARDVTRSQTALAALRLEQERLRFHLQSSGIWYWEQDSQFRYTGVWYPERRHEDPVLSRQVGRRRWEAANVDPTDAKWATHITECKSHRHFRDFEYECQSSSGQIVILSVNGTPVFADDGSFAGYRGIARDVTHERQKQQRLQLFDELVRQSSEMILVTDADIDAPGPRILFANQALLAHTGYSEAELLGQNPRIFQGPQTDRNLLKALREALIAGRPFAGETYNYGKYGAEYLVHWHIDPVRDASGRVSYFVARLRDVTAERDWIQSGKSLQHQMSKDAEEARAENDAFIRTLSHDLRAPIRAVRGFSELMLDQYGGQIPLDAQAMSRRVIRAAEDLTQMLDGLADLSRLSRLKPHRDPLDLSALARESASRMAHQFAKENLGIEIAPGLTAQADLALIRVVLDNLLGNAIKYSTKVARPRIQFGAVSPLTSRSSLGTTDETQIFFVRDNGAGFDMAYAAQLFQPFQRLHSADEFPGTGLGLTTTQRIIQRHGGRIWAEALVGQGATFFFTLPHSGALN